MPRKKISALSVYKHATRAEMVHKYWITGEDEESIAEMLNITPRAVAKDLQYYQTKLTPRQILAQNNDRNRILLQKHEAPSYRNLVSAALRVPMDRYIAEGISPAPIMKEFREATGMTERPGGVSVHLTQQNLNVEQHTIGSSEELIRRAMTEIERERIPVLTPGPDLEIHPVEDDSGDS